MLVGFRFNANSVVGLGHFNRCNAIALELKNAGVSSLAIVDLKFEQSSLVSHFNEIIKINSQFNDAELTAQICRERGISTLLIDHYHCTRNYQQTLIQYNVDFGQYDYKCEGAYLGRFLININPSANVEWYQHCNLSENTSLHLGARYAIISPLLKALPMRCSGLFLCLGGGDDKKIAVSLINQIRFFYKGDIHFACTSLSSSLPIIQSHNDPHLYIYVNQTNLSDILSSCHYAIVAAGTLSYEMAFVGIKFSCGYYVNNQIKMAEAWHQSNFANNLGDLSKTLDDKALNEIKIHLNRVSPRSSFIDGLAAKRIAQVLIKQ